MKTLNLTSVDLGDCVDTDGGSDVDVSGDGGAPHEVPVLVVGGQLFADGGLDDVHPFGQLDLSGPDAS